MSETNNSDKSVGAPPPKATLHLKRPVEQGSVRQSFSHGRSKTVVVEKVKRRILTPGEAPPTAAPAQVAVAPAKPIFTAAARSAPVAPAKPAAPPPPKTGVVLPTLTAEQREARARA
ncbi:MAG: translation initiation factor IF-2 associated domain-containing protein, partial [Roseiarcus sp.]|uniref:translation initiation factor IF-2 associated domain-containing protein n=1 Tax=Roseiarcus sp. TaxID=1969460 RepID=UPI003C3BF9AB